MPQLALTIETDAPLGSRATVEKMLSALQRISDWLPERFGTSEPLRETFAHDRFVDLWTSQNRNGGRVASVLFSKRRMYEATAIWRPTGAQLGSVHFALKTRDADIAIARRYLRAGADLFDALDGQYGYLCTKAEFWNKNVTGWWVGHSGEPEGGSAHGTDRTRHLPGVYWANYFGPLYLAFFGEHRVRSAPAFETLETERSCILVTADNPFSWTSSGARECEGRIREHLGEDAFFNIENPNGSTRAPLFGKTRD